MPTNAVIFPDAVCSDVVKGERRGDIAATGSLGGGYAPFIPGAGGQLQKNMRLNLPRDRLADRRQLLRQLDRLNRQVEAAGELDARSTRSRSRRIEVLLSGGVADALDLSKEDAKTLALATTPAATPGPTAGARWRAARRGFYTGHARALGKQLLLARRLCEAGCGFVTIHAGYDGVWDMHADGNNLNMKDGMEAVGPASITPWRRSSRTCEARGLSDKILLVCCGEMGRTPQAQQERRPRSLGQAGAAAPVRRRHPGRPGDRPLQPRRRRAGQRYLQSPRT